MEKNLAKREKGVGEGTEAGAREGGNLHGTGEKGGFWCRNGTKRGV